VGYLVHFDFVIHYTYTGHTLTFATTEELDKHVLVLVLNLLSNDYITILHKLLQPRIQTS
jgi:hypothetical protein